MPGIRFTSLRNVMATLAVTMIVLAADSFASSPATGSISATSTAPLTWTGTAPATGSAQGEDTCVDGVNCDTFTLTISGTASDWAGYAVKVDLGWSLPANDYDLVIHKGSVTGPLISSSGNGAPDTFESAAIYPSATGIGTYTVHVVYFATTPGVDQYKGTATVVARPPTRPANYQTGGITFSPSVRLYSTSNGHDGEPSNRTDVVGNAYVSAIRGVPAGVDLWWFDLNPNSSTYDPYMRNPKWRGKTDNFTADESTSVGADGGGDVDLAVGLPDPATGINNDPPTLASSSLVVGNISTQRSSDRGVSFNKNLLGNATGGVPVDDRQWMAFYGKDTVYMLYRTADPVIAFVQRSTDGGLTYGPAVQVGSIGQVGSIDVDQKDGTIYVSGSSGNVCASTPAVPGGDPGAFSCSLAAADPNGVAHLFFITKVAPDQTVYAAYSNDIDILLTHSTDHGKTWAQPVRVSNGDATRISVFPHLGTGKAPGTVGLVWYGSSNFGNFDEADWNVFYAYSANATAATPTFTQVKAGDHVIHASNISEGGLTGSANRNLIDYFQVSYDPTGAAVIAYADDHNDYDGATFVTRQISGPAINGGSVPVPKEGTQLPAKPARPAVPQVTDFAQDQEIGLLAVTPTNSPYDVLSVTYACEDPGAGTLASNPMLVTTMKVSDLSVTPPGANWRMSFAANAPNSVMSPTGDYTFGVSDRGDQFYFRASSDPSQPQFAYGTAFRDSDGSMAYTKLGTADAGAFDAATGTIRIKVALSKLNAALPAGHAKIANGSVLVGLRGETFTSASTVGATNDTTPGGTQYVVQCGGSTTGGGPGKGGNGNANVVQVTGSGTLDDKAESFRLDVRNNFGSGAITGQVLYQDPNAGPEMVSDTITSFTQNGPNSVTMTGTGHMGKNVVTFTITVQDNGEPGSKDTFSISIPGYPSHQGNLSSGNIQVHN